MEEKQENTTNYRFFLNNQNQIINKYKLLKEIGKGSYGNVFSCQHIKNKKPGAIKIIKKQSNYIKSAEKEIDILKLLKHNNIIKFDTSFYYNNYICIVFKLYFKNLYQYTLNEYYLSQATVKELLLNICKGLEYLFKQKIIHRDLKPENILLKNDNSLDLVLCDFGLSIEYSKLDNEDEYGKYNVQSSWYRAPEPFLKIDYDMSLDIWSLGCIAYELYWKKPLFKCNTNKDLFISHNVFLGPPSLSFLEKYPYIHEYYDDIKNPSIIYFRNKVYSIKNIEFKQNHKSNYELFEIILLCCKWDSKLRLKPNEAIKLLEEMK